MDDVVRNRIIQHYMKFIENNQCTVYCLEDLQYTLEEIEHALRVEWMTTLVDRKKFPQWEKYLESIEVVYVLLGSVVTKEDFAIVLQTENAMKRMGSAIERGMSITQAEDFKHYDAGPALEISRRTSENMRNYGERLEGFKEFAMKELKSKGLL